MFLLFRSLGGRAPIPNWEEERRGEGRGGELLFNPVVFAAWRIFGVATSYIGSTGDGFSGKGQRSWKEGGRYVLAAGKKQQTILSRI